MSKTKKIISIILLLALLGGVVWCTVKYTQKPKPVAENSYPAIQLSKEIKPKDAVDAVLAYRESGSKENLSEKYRNIITEIEIKQLEMNGNLVPVDQPKEEVDLTVKTNGRISEEQSKVSSDSVILIKDGQGNPLEPQIASRLKKISKPSLVKLFGDALAQDASGEFVFDASVSNTSRQIFLDTYLRVKEIFGERSVYWITDPQNREKYGKISVSVIPDTEINTICRASAVACYTPSLNIIYVSQAHSENVSTIAHELTHAFHGLFVMHTNYEDSRIWSEGMATFVEGRVANIGILGTNTFETHDVPFRNYRELDGDGDALSAFRLGQIAMEKITMEDAQFLSKFNQKYYEFAVGSSPVPSYIQIAAMIVPKIEDLSTYEWFAERQMFVSNGEIKDGSIYIHIDGMFTLGQKQKFFVVTSPDVMRYSLKIYDHKQKLLASVVENEINNRKKEYDLLEITYDGQEEFLENYTGILQFSLTTNNNELNTRNQYLPIMTQAQKANLNIESIGLVIGGNPKSVSVQKLSGGQKANCFFQNGLFAIYFPNITQSQKYMVEVMSEEPVCNNSICSMQAKKISRTINIPYSRNLEMIVVNAEKKNCCKDASNCPGRYCGKTVVAENQFGLHPVTRLWTNDLLSDFTNQKYLYFLDTSSGWGIKNFILL